MTCRSLTLLSGLLIAASWAGTVEGQQPRRQTLADRIRGWTQNETPPAATTEVLPPSRGVAAPEQVGEPAAQRRGFPQIDARSLLPSNLFGGRGDQQPTTVDPPAPTSGRNIQTVPLQPARTNPTSTLQSQSASNANVPLRTAARPRAGSAQSAASLRDGFTLPGLGGAPLPSGAIAPAKQPRIAQAQQNSTPSAPNRNVAREIAGDDSAIQSDGHPDATAPPVSLHPATGRSSGLGARQSPHRRAPLHVDADVLRRELAGAFPTASPHATAASSTTPDETASAAQPEPAATSDTETNSESPMEPVAESNAQPVLEMDEQESGDPPVTLPVVEAPTTRMQMLNIGAPSPSTSEITLQRQPPVRPRNDAPTRRDGAAAFGAEQNTNDSELNFGFAKPAGAPRPVGTPVPTSPSSVAAPTVQPTVTIPSATRRREVFGDAGQGPITDPNVLASHQTPVITTDIRGPKQILIGREATYRVRLQNQGQVSAEGIIANIRIPAGADIVDTATTHGTIQQSRDAELPGGLEWQLTRLEAGASETLDVRLVPRSSRPLELGVSWTLAPIGSRAVVEVQEPKLRLHVSGPDEVLFGKSQLYRLTLTNPGTGIAENVKIDLLPPGGGEDAVTSHPVGDLPAGTSQSIEVELTAREAGKLYVKAIAIADGGLTSDASKEIFCRKPELEVDWRGPETKYTGTEATHFFRVRNPGTATAENVTVTVTLPEGAELVSASEGQAFNAERREVAWRIGSLGPGDDYYMELKCVVNASGLNQMNITAATAAGDLVDTSAAQTNVIALADLKLNVSDPQGPIAVGDEAVYEIRVQNRGASAAQGVNVVALFSEGVEPDTVEGAMYSVADGRVSFRTIEELPAGKQVVLRIRAHAQQPGNHVFRAEVLCRELDIKLAAEETTRFYADQVFDNEEGTKQAEQSPAPQQSPPTQLPVEVSDRYQAAPK